MNIDVAYIACLFSNNEKDFVWRKIERDLDEEENNILLLQDFWNNNVLARVEPEFTEKPDMVLDALRRYYGPADCALPTVEIDPSYLPSLLQIADLRAQKSILESQARKLEEQIKVAYIPFAEQLGNACAAVCQGNSQRVTITYHQRAEQESLCSHRGLAKPPLAGRALSIRLRGRHLPASQLGRRV